MEKHKKITEETKAILLSLYNEGKMDTEIAKILNVSDSAIYYWRKKLNLKSKFNYSKISKIDNVEFEKLFNLNLSDYKIAKILKMSPDGVYSHRMRHGYFRKNDLRFNKKIKLSNFQKQVLIGTLLGDSSFKKSGKTSVGVSCAHSIKQKEYCEYKTKIFENLNAKCTYHKRNVLDKRTNKYYEDYTMYIPVNPEFKSWNELLYSNKIKIIPRNLILEYFTEVSLAFMYMDDGYKTGKNYSIATQSFNGDDLIWFVSFLYNKFKIESTVQKNNIIYIKANSRNLFTNLISPYICNCMKYKLQSLNSVNLGKS